MMQQESFQIDDLTFQLASPGVLLDISAPLHIRSALHDYDVSFYSGPLTAGELTVEYASQAESDLLIVDEQVYVSHLSMEALSVDRPILRIEASERMKSIDGAISVLDFFVDHRVTRQDRIVVAGGGSTQDVVGFSCSVYKRGIPWHYLPTTLLAQSDSCIGSKTGINFRHTKNLLGVFSAPESVVVHKGFLESLSDTDVLSGLGEIFKLGITAGPGFLEAFERLLDAGISRDSEALIQLVRMALAIKKSVIERDEFEQDSRRALNFGHSIGHAIEVVSDYAVSHGLAVCFGLLVESALSYSDEALSDDDLSHLIRTASRLLPPEIIQILRTISVASLCEVLVRDKKVTRGGLVFPVPIMIGQMRFTTLDLGASMVSTIERACSLVLERL